MDGLRRLLQIPNAQAYVDLAKVFETNWSALEAHLKSQSVSQSRPIPKRGAERAMIPLLALRDAPKLRARRWRGRRYIMRADISQFYASLYTHSLPWALHTKAVAKKNRTNYGDDLDRGFRNLMDGQTSGIPIGPDASLLAAEVLLTTIDKKLGARTDLTHGFRYIDDYEFAFASTGEAEDALVALEALMTEYELRLNPVKTMIVQTPEPFQELWVSELLTYPIRTRSAKTTINDVLAYFSHAAGLARTYPRHAVLRYALTRARDFRIARVGWRTSRGSS